MGALCSRRATADCTLSTNVTHVNGHVKNGSKIVDQSRAVNRDNNLVWNPIDNRSAEPCSSTEISADDINDGIPQLSRTLSHESKSRKPKQAAVAKVSEVGSLLGRAGTAGLGKAVEVLDTLGSSMTSLQLGSGFTSGVSTKGNRISILAFEVANTVVKGANLMQALSEDNIKHLKEVVLPSEGVQRLTSRDLDELLRIAAADKRDELKIFCGEVVRFGNRCKDPQWHNLDRYFEKLGSELAHQKELKKEAETVMHQLMTSVQYTAELYHELNALDRFEQDYRRKLQEENSSIASHRGDSLAILKAELKSQKKHVRTLKKKSLWSRVLEEVMEKLVDIVHYIHMEIHEAFGCADEDRPVKNKDQKLGPAGLALHYANIITQIDTLVSRSSSVPSSTRDALYQGLPPSIKSALRFKLQTFNLEEELTVAQIKAEIEKTLHWLVPMATNTTKAHHGFGWVGEWANTGKPAGQMDLIRLETLYHADKDKTETYILELVVWLHHLVSQSRSVHGRSPVKSPLRSPNKKTIQLSSNKLSSSLPALTIEDQEMLRNVSKRKLTPGISKSQEFDMVKSGSSKHHRLSKSSSHTPTREMRKNPFPVRRPSSVPIFDFNIDRIKALDVIDRVDMIPR